MHLSDVEDEACLAAISLCARFHRPPNQLAVRVEQANRGITCTTPLPVVETLADERALVLADPMTILDSLATDAAPHVTVGQSFAHQQLSVTGCELQTGSMFFLIRSRG